MRRRRLAAGLATIGLLLALGIVVLIASGAYNIAASAPHTRFTQWLLNTVQERSVIVRADDVPTPPPTDSEMVRHGLEEYRAMCATCHGAPGVERSELGKGMNPKPPDLAEEAAEWSDRELFWITKHGIKLAGMPAFGVTHSDRELWGIVAFLRRLESMSPEEYRRLTSEAETHTHAGMVEIAPQAEAHTQEVGDRTGHAHEAEAVQRPGAQTPSRRRSPRVDHGGMPGHRRVADEATPEPAVADTDGTEKLKTLAAELLRDSAVLARVQTDSALRRRWENDSVRTQLTKPPR